MQAQIYPHLVKRFYSHIHPEIVLIGKNDIKQFSLTTLNIFIKILDIKKIKKNHDDIPFAIFLIF